MASLAELQEKMKQIKGVIRTIQTQMGQNQIPDLAPLSQAVNEMCTAIPTLPPADGQKLKPTLLAMLDDVDKIENQLHARKDGLVEQMRKISPNRQALKAYGMGGASLSSSPDKPEKK